MTRPKPKPTPHVKRSWYIKPGTDQLICYKNSKDDCAVSGLWQAGQSEFHDAELQTATEEINKILDRVDRDNEDAERRLSLIQFRNRWMLVWIHSEKTVTGENPEHEVAKALKVKGFRPR
jgi:hypothetical protein